MSPGERSSWLGLVGLSVAAILTIVACDWAIQRIYEPKHLREVSDGVRDLAAANPQTLVLGSSHARTFHVLGEELRALSHGRQQLVAVPLENGKLVPYRWVLERRLAPLIDERDADGQRVRDRLERFVLLTEWWDTCPMRPPSPYWNLPSRAWTASDFLADVAEHGIVGFNRNYLQSEFRQALPYSVLAYDRSQRLAIDQMTRAARGMPLGRTEGEEAEFVEAWRRNVERGDECIGDHEQIAALEGIVGFAKARGLDTTIVLFPRKPGTLTEHARSTTLQHFAASMREFATRNDVRLIDLTTRSPLGDGDFMSDFDHVNREGNLKFAHWALEHDLKFLLEPAAHLSAQGRASP